MRNGLYRFAPQAALALPAWAQDAPNNSDLTVAQPVVAYHATVASQEAAASRAAFQYVDAGASDPRQRDTLAIGY